jgi:nitroreductase
MLLSLLRKRRSIRRFEPRPVERKKIDSLVEALLRSPSSRSLNPWEFIVVTDPVLLAKLGRCKEHGAAFVKGAALAVVVCADADRCDVWVEDCSIAATLLQLLAAELGLGSCWVQIRLRRQGGTRTAEEYVRELLRIPENLRVASMVALGYPDETKSSHPEASLRYDKVHFNAFNGQ